MATIPRHSSTPSECVQSPVLRLCWNSRMCLCVEKTSGRDVRTIVPCVQPLLRHGPMAEEHGTRPRGGSGGGGYCQHRPREFLDERGEVRPSGSRAYLRRTRSEIQCVPSRLITEKSHHTRSPSAWEFMSARRMPESSHFVRDGSLMRSILTYVCAL